MRKQIELLEDHADLFAQLAQRRPVRAVAGFLVALGGEHAVDRDGTALDRLERGKAAQQRALAGPARPNDDQNLSGSKLQADVVEDHIGPVTLDQAIHDDQRFAHGRYARATLNRRSIHSTSSATG